MPDTESIGVNGLGDGVWQSLGIMLIRHEHEILFHKKYIHISALLATTYFCG